MFKRNKKEQPPAAPNFSEILKDLETFHIKKTAFEKTRNLENYKQSSTQDVTEFWKLFETFTSDVEDLKQMKTDINGFKLQLELNKLEIDTTSKNIKSNIEQYLENSRKTTKKEE